jgi:glyoxylase-like metal-dependent hydrolase (beta-lactamase superfamily II)
MPSDDTALHVGDARIDAVADGTMVVRGEEVLRRPGYADAWDAHRSLLNDDGELELTVGGFLVRTGDRRVLVDAGLGPIRRGDMQGGALLDGLAALGVGPADITDVVLTHLHFDHVGWTTSKGRIVFPRATYRCHEADWAHFVSSADADPGAVRKLSPLTGQLALFTDGATLAPGVDARSAPGHTPGSTIVVLSSGAARSMLLGDVAHCPFELTEPDWEALFDVDPALARRTREALARELEGTDVPAAAAHFPGMRFGRLVSASGARRWTFA